MNPIAKSCGWRRGKRPIPLAQSIGLDCVLDLAIEHVRPALRCEQFYRRKFHFHGPPEKIEKDTDPLFRGQ